MTPRVFVVIPTHTTRHLACCLASLVHAGGAGGAGGLLPAGVVLSCDVDKPEIAALVDHLWPRACAAAGVRIALWHTCRPHQGVAQLNQVRNNGLRALLETCAPRTEDVVVMLDGDTMLVPGCLDVHARLAAQGAEMIVPYRAELTEAQTQAFVGPDAWQRVAREPATITALFDDVADGKLAARQKRYERHLLWRALGLHTLTGKLHKPKMLGGHHAVSFRALKAVNGYDELYRGYRFDDDDLSRRLLSLRPRLNVAIAVSTALAAHLWHPTRATEAPEKSPGFARWSIPNLPTFCEFGIASPQPQPLPTLRQVGG